MQIGLEPLPLERLQPAVTRHEWDRLRRAVDSTAPLLAGRRVWVVNSTAVGGGVAELIRSLLGPGA